MDTRPLSLYRCRFYSSGPYAAVRLTKWWSVTPHLTTPPCKRSLHADSEFSECQGRSNADAIRISTSNSYFQSCVFKGISRPNEAREPRDWPLLYGAVNVYGANATLVLENCTLSAIKNPDPIVLVNGGWVYSDDPEHVVRLLCGHVYCEPVTTIDAQFLIWI